MTLIAKIFGWLSGLLLFVFLELLLFISPGSRLFRHLRKEKDEPGPDKIIIAIPQPLKLGPLPQDEGIPVKYHLPDNLPDAISEVQIQARITASSNEAIERDYRLYFTSAKFKPQDFYLFVSPFNDDPGLSYNEATLWIPITEDKCFYIDISGKVLESTLTKPDSCLSLIAYR